MSSPAAEKLARWAEDPVRMVIDEFKVEKLDPWQVGLPEGVPPPGRDWRRSRVRGLGRRRLRRGAAGIFSERGGREDICGGDHGRQSERQPVAGDVEVAGPQ